MAACLPSRTIVVRRDLAAEQIEEVKSADGHDWPDLEICSIAAGRPEFGHAEMALGSAP